MDEERKKKGSLAPWLISGGLLAAAGTGVALASKGKVKANPELTKEYANDAEKLIKDLKSKSKTQKPRVEVEVKPEPKKSLGYLGLSKTEKQQKVKSRQDKLGTLFKFAPKSSTVKGEDAQRIATNKMLRNKNNQTIERIKNKFITNYMKYTTTADFALAGALPTNTGVLNKVTGKLGQTVEKAKNWLGKAQQAKKEVGSASIAKQRLLPKTSPNAAAEAIAKHKYGSVGVETAPALKSTIGTRTKSLDDSLKLRDKAALRTDLTAGAARQVNRGSADRFSKAGSQASINDNRSLRIKYTKDPRTGKLVSAAYNKLSLLCDI